MQLQLTLSTSTKQCHKCGAVKPLAEFHRDRYAPDGLCRSCKPCMIANAARLWRESEKHRVNHRRVSQRSYERVADRIRLVRLALSCCVCGETETACLDLHHVDPSMKAFSFGGKQAKGKSWASVRAEIAKCACLCANCHRKVHAGLIDGSDLATVSLAFIDAATDS